MTSKKKIKAYDILLQKHIDKKDYLSFDRTFNNVEADIAGFLLAMSKDFLLIQRDNEFRLDGYSIIRADGYDSFRCGKFQNAKKRIFKAEGLLDSYGIDKTISLASWPRIFEDLKKSDYPAIIIECEEKQKPEFLIGPIQRVAKDKVSIQNCDPAGQLDDKPTSVKYDEITIITFGGSYSQTLGKYLKPSKIKKK